MHNDLYIKIWATQKISELAREFEVCNTLKESYIIEGKVQLLHQLLDEFELNKVKDDSVIHKDF